VHISGLPPGSSEPLRVSGMLGQTHHRRQSAGGPGRINTTASAAPSSRSNQDAAAPEPRGGEAGTLPGVAEGKVREDLPDDRRIVQRGDQA